MSLASALNVLRPTLPYYDLSVSTADYCSRFRPS